MRKILFIMMLMVSAVSNAQKSGDLIKVFGKTYEVESVKKVMNFDTNSYEVSIETRDCFLITYNLKNGNRTNIKVKDIRKQKEEEFKKTMDTFEACRKIVEISLNDGIEKIKAKEKAHNDSIRAIVGEMPQSKNYEDFDEYLEALHDYEVRLRILR